MSFREFEGKSHASVYRKYREKPPKHLIDHIVNYLSEKYAGKLSQAVDLGCGSGQCTFLLCDQFERVLGTDISPAQIEEAQVQAKETGTNNVEFCESSAHEIPLENDSVQLITACTAAHWFDLERVYAEGRRVLCNNGVMAFLCTFETEVRLEGHPEKQKGFDDIRNYLWDFMTPLFPPPILLVMDKYKDIEIPYSDLKREDGFFYERKVSISNILGLYRSYSPFQTYCRNNGESAGEEILNNIKKRYLETSGIAENDIDSPLLTMKVIYFVIMARLQK